MKFTTSNDENDALVHEFMHVSRVYNMALRPNPTLRPGDPPQHPRNFFLLGLLQKQERFGYAPISQSDIGADLRLAAPTITLMLNDLEKEGYVERFRDTQDRRIVRVKLTREGDQLLTEQFELYRDKILGLIECLGDDDAQKLIELMQRVIECMPEVNQNPLPRK